MSSSDKTTPSLTIDRAAFLLLRVKKAFRKKKQQRKEKSAPSAAECNKQESKPVPRGPGTRPAPLLRSRTLPAIVAPGLNILQAQLDARCSHAEAESESSGAAGSIRAADSRGPMFQKRESSASYCGKLLAPRISFTDDGLGERRVSDTGPNYRESLFKETSSRLGGKLNSYALGSSQPLTKLARLLNQRPSFVPVPDDIPRRLSWERKERAGSSSCLPRSSSIDSVAECNYMAGLDAGLLSSCRQLASETEAFGQLEQCMQKRSSSPLLGSRADRHSLASPNIGRRVKGQRGLLGTNALLQALRRICAYLG